MVDAEAKKILTGLWADTGDRTDPEDLGVDRAGGWDVAYELPGTGREPERTLGNQRFRELDGWAADRMRGGIPGWDGEINYLEHAFVTVGGALYVANRVTGPETDNTTSPDATGQTVWRRY